MLSMTEYMKICRTLLHRHIRTCMCGALCDLLAPPPPPFLSKPYQFVTAPCQTHETIDAADLHVDRCRTVENASE